MTPLEHDLEQQLAKAEKARQSRDYQAVIGFCTQAQATARELDNLVLNWTPPSDDFNEGI